MNTTTITTPTTHQSANTPATVGTAMHTAKGTGTPLTTVAVVVAVAVAGGQGVATCTIGLEPTSM